MLKVVIAVFAVVMATSLIALGLWAARPSNTLPSAVEILQRGFSLGYAMAQPRAPDVDWAASLQSAAKELRIELTDECMAELRAHIELYGFERGAVTLRGVLIRDRDGMDKWLCAGR